MGVGDERAGSLTTQRTVLVIALALFAGLLSILVFWKPASGAANVPPRFTDEQYGTATGLDRPTAMEFAPDGRLFVAEIGGTIRVIKNGTLLEEPFVTIPDVEATSGAGDGRGLLGITFDPDFSTNNFVYVHYTQVGPDGQPSHNRVVRFTANGDVAAEQQDGGIGESIIELDDLGTSTVDNGGHIDFGNDGKLYIPVGYNKRDRDPPIIENLFSLRHFFGKVLRINADGTIPADNPFYDKATGKYRAIYARGFRNPFSFAVKPPPGNKIYINDVGERTWEEIDNLRAGKNYGWPVCEGEQILLEDRTTGGECPTRYTDPIFTYLQNEGAPATCAITAGTFYKPPSSASARFPAEYRGDYFFADLCGGWIKRYDPQTDKVIDEDPQTQETEEPFATGVLQPVDLKVGPDGGLYYLERGTSSVRVIRPSS